MPRPSGPTQADETAKCLFRHGLKAFAFHGALPLQALANGYQLVITDALWLPLAVSKKRGRFTWNRLNF